MRLRSAARAWPILLVLLAGCGGLPAGSGGELPQRAFHEVRQSRTESAGTLLYLVCCSPSASEITVVTYPQGKPFATIEGLYDPYGMCADSSGNVWVVNVGGLLYEYAHGGTTPVNRLWVPNTWLATDCAADPSTGNLAVINYGGPYGPSLDVWANEKGTPTVYPIGFTPWSCAYDAAGNLYVDGFVSGSDTNFQFAELPKGGSAFVNVTLDKPAEWPASVRWDGKYVAVGTAGRKWKQRIYRVRVSGSKGTVVTTLFFDRMKGEQQVSFQIQGHTIVADTGHFGNAPISIWSYPNGHQPFTRLHGLWGRYMAVSVAPSK